MLRAREQEGDPRGYVDQWIEGREGRYLENWLAVGAGMLDSPRNSCRGSLDYRHRNGRWSGKDNDCLANDTRDFSRNIADLWDDTGLFDDLGFFYDRWHEDGGNLGLTWAAS